MDTGAVTLDLPHKAVHAAVLGLKWKFGGHYKLPTEKLAFLKAEYEDELATVLSDEGPRGDLMFTASPLITRC